MSWKLFTLQALFYVHFKSSGNSDEGSTAVIQIPHTFDARLHWQPFLVGAHTQEDLIASDDAPCLTGGGVRIRLRSSTAK